MFELKVYFDNAQSSSYDSVIQPVPVDPKPKFVVDVNPSIYAIHSTPQVDPFYVI